MTYIVQRQDRFYVVAYDGLDPLTGRERRRWYPVGHDPGEADALAARLDRERTSAPPKVGGPVTVSQFLRDTGPRKRRQVRHTTAYRYAWFVDRYIIPAIGDIPLRRLRVDHLDALCAAQAGGQRRSKRYRLAAHTGCVEVEWSSALPSTPPASVSWSSATSPLPLTSGCHGLTGGTADRRPVDLSTVFGREPGTVSTAARRQLPRECVQAVDP